MRAKKITAFILAAALCATSMSGCGINKDAKAASMNGQTVTLGVANFYCRYEQATMEDAYKAYLQTSDIWSKDISGNGTTLEETVKDQAMETLHEMYTLQAHMKDYNVELTDADKKAVKEAAQKFMDSNSTEAIKEMGATEDIVEEILTLYTVRDKMKDAILFKNLDHKYMTLKECIEKNGGKAEPEEKTEGENAEQSAEKKEAEKTTIYYVTDEQQQSQYINMFKKEGLDAVILSHNIDSPFITQMEQKNEHIKFQRIDADLTDHFKEDVSEEEKEAFKEKTDSLVEIFRKALGNDKLEVKVEKMKDENVASMITLSEESRRMQEMMKMYGMSGMDPSMFGTNATLILNANHPLVEYVVAHKDGENTEMFCHQLYDLAMLAHKPLSPEEMTEFVKRSNEIMMKLAK